MKEFGIDYELINHEDLDKIENLLKAKLSSDYKKHMLKFNGGTVPLDKEYVFNFNENELVLEGFHQVKYGEGNLEDYYAHNIIFYFQIYCLLEQLWEVF
ncbi:hypothetical protein SAMN04489761_2832 [Tenacibaculum sp. MAR_2009_124]|uniref:SMI1/KNR4 family protein n=1 Tax=Tenacibaculum sp. MAR_2009_124 TaxID=1250059 RepID=UPI000896C31B|nr:SMI1/KNR4 family protein [Tenacibaculum sp. MAR_2009_124]SEC38042.1 hypothetical protein SAMN04489761_2832 [Tenacibaculum sp. MAR_2009_124]